MNQFLKVNLGKRVRIVVKFAMVAVMITVVFGLFKPCIVKAEKDDKELKFNYIKQIDINSNFVDESNLEELIPEYYRKLA
ncbi:hypothetical protein Calkro_2509 [Caldicellulosiruptor kronotskyensis 2002]|uniref:Uncharacterized protein n=1 Tax=Caldicellulosiruptor kronotskyensis (strain DSM 18902 / VKM B-2412 / 2002) TaxID=632348 RepID=E4SHT7_CALK2|nr:hypothetical protein [Caldicellulosiruptor kronotskyensis]ADQ47312.1 hypothetical protein Calkro_2509 [Caldicellulosiruptor kronotskyensis 2002]